MGRGKWETQDVVREVREGCEAGGSHRMKGKRAVFEGM